MLLQSKDKGQMVFQFLIKLKNLYVFVLVLKIGAKKPASKRWIRYRIILIYGSFWGYFTRGNNPVEIYQKGLEIHALNTSMRFSRTGKKFKISSISGYLKVFNNVSSLKLNSGQRLYQIQKNDFLPQKVLHIYFL